MKSFLNSQTKFQSGRKTYPAENTIIYLYFASSLEFTPVNIVFTMKVLLLLLPLEREREERRERERGILKETHRKRKNSHMWCWRWRSMTRR
jgi:hypothetical protein